MISRPFVKIKPKIIRRMAVTQLVAVIIEEHKTTMKIEVRKTMNYEDYESTLYSWIFVGTVGL
jgi:hypothetical protein